MPSPSASQSAPSWAGRDGQCLAVDIGGTKMAVALVDRDGKVRISSRLDTPTTDDGAELWGALERLVASVVGSRTDVVVCGVGCGGPMDLHGEHVSPLNIPGWREFPLRARLAELTGAPTFVDNDAKALALAEGWTGVARGARNYMAMVVSTGVGGGIVVDGRLLGGRLGNAGHVGHVVVEPAGRLCTCGGRGCLEAEASGTAIAAITGRPAPEAPPEVVERTGVLVGRAVASVVNLLDLALVAVGGSVALGFGAPFFEAAQRTLAEHARLLFARDARIVPVGLGPDGPVVGAAAVGWRGLARATGDPRGGSG